MRRRRASRAAATCGDRVSVVETNQPFTIAAVQRQGIGESVGAFRRRLDALGDELYPVMADRIDDEHDAIKREKVVKSLIIWWFRQ